MKIVVAIDSFKGSLSSLEAGRAAGIGIRRADSAAGVEIFPLAESDAIKTSEVVGAVGNKIRVKVFSGG